MHNNAAFVHKYTPNITRARVKGERQKVNHNYIFHILPKAARRYFGRICSNYTLFRLSFCARCFFYGKYAKTVDK
jgi:hypothetical protein